MKEVFKDSSLQNAFEKTVEDYEKFRAIISKQIDCSDHSQIIEHMSELTGIMYIGITCKAKFQFLTEKLSFQKSMNLNNENMSATEKKVIIAYEIGDCSFYNSICEMLIKEAHYKQDMLRSALSFIKQEINTI